LIAAFPLSKVMHLIQQVLVVHLNRRKCPQKHLQVVQGKPRQVPVAHFLHYSHAKIKELAASRETTKVKAPGLSYRSHFGQKIFIMVAKRDASPFNVHKLLGRKFTQPPDQQVGANRVKECVVRNALSGPRLYMHVESE